MKTIQCEKIKYTSEKSATHALRQQQRWNASVCRVYFCDKCHFWHLTSLNPTFKGSGKRQHGKGTPQKLKALQGKNGRSGRNPYGTDKNGETLLGDSIIQSKSTIRYSGGMGNWAAGIMQGSEQGWR